jgi:hypothetical protein
MLARRRLAAEAGSQSELGDPPSEDEETPSKIGTPNSFSALQKLSRQGDSPSLSVAQVSRRLQSPSKAPRQGSAKRSEELKTLVLTKFRKLFTADLEKRRRRNYQRPTCPSWVPRRSVLVIQANETELPCHR